MNIIAIKDNLRQSEPPLVTYFLIAINVVCFLYQSVLFDGLSQAQRVTYGVIPQQIVHQLASGHPDAVGQALWTMFSAMFLHSGWLHLIPNMVMLYAFGSSLEWVFGGRIYAAFYFVTGMLGTLVFVLLGNWLPMSVSSIGASVAIFGLMGGYLMTLPNTKMFGAVLIFNIPIPVPFMLKSQWVICAIWLLQVIDVLWPEAGPFGSRVNWIEHFGGFGAGIYLSSLMLKRATNQRS